MFFLGHKHSEETKIKMRGKRQERFLDTLKDKKWLENKYLDLDMNLIHISKLANCCLETVAFYLRKHKIKIRTSFSKIIYKSGEKNPRYNGGVSENAERIFIRKNNVFHPRARLVASDLLKRTLKSTEIVHHIDENKKNDAPENLFVFRNSSSHLRWHNFLRRHNLDGKILKTNLCL